MPSLFIIAGANGAGKTTASKVIFPEVLNVIDLSMPMKLQEDFHPLILKEFFLKQEELCEEEFIN